MFIVYSLGGENVKFLEEVFRNSVTICVAGDCDGGDSGCRIKDLRGNLMPRPKGSKNKSVKENRKEVCLYVRCTQEEKEKLVRLAEENGVSLSRFILQKCFS